MRLSECPKVLLESGKLTIVLMFIIANAMLFAHVLPPSRYRRHRQLGHRNWDFRRWMFLLVVNIVLLIAGNFVEPFGDHPDPGADLLPHRHGAGHRSDPPPASSWW
ncbi:TRAP transporter large permease subunit [Pseudomonas aeruginosa]